MFLLEFSLLIRYPNCSGQFIRNFTWPEHAEPFKIPRAPSPPCFHYSIIFENLLLKYACANPPTPIAQDHSFSKLHSLPPSTQQLHCRCSSDGSAWNHHSQELQWCLTWDSLKTQGLAVAALPGLRVTSTETRHSCTITTCWSSNKPLSWCMPWRPCKVSGICCWST